MRCAIKRVGYSWRVYVITDSEWGPRAKVVRSPEDAIRNFGTEQAARDWIMEQPDATEVAWADS